MQQEHFNFINLQYNVKYQIYSTIPTINIFNLSDLHKDNREGFYHNGAHRSRVIIKITNPRKFDSSISWFYKKMNLHQKHLSTLKNNLYLQKEDRDLILLKKYITIIIEICNQYLLKPASSIQTLYDISRYLIETNNELLYLLSLLKNDQALSLCLITPIQKSFEHFSRQILVHIKSMMYEFSLLNFQLWMQICRRCLFRKSTIKVYAKRRVLLDLPRFSVTRSFCKPIVIYNTSQRKCYFTTNFSYHQSISFDHYLPTLDNTYCWWWSSCNCFQPIIDKEKNIKWQSQFFNHTHTKSPYHYWRTCKRNQKHKWMSDQDRELMIKTRIKRNIDKD